MKTTIIYPRGMRLDVGKLKGAGAGKMKVIIEEANEDGRQ